MRLPEELGEGFNGGLRWFARHEARLAWRDWLSLMTAGHRRSIRTVILAFLVFGLVAHGLAWLIIASPGTPVGVAGTAGASAGDQDMLLAITGTLALSWSLMLSQAMESVTRSFYARGDLELILTSPAAASRLFAVRIVAMSVTIMVMSLVLGAPFINMMAWLKGPRWLLGYPVAAALAMTAVAIAIAVTIALFRAVGARRTRLIAQVLAAVIGAGFAIGLQLAAIISYGVVPTTSGARWAVLTRIAPPSGSVLWWPARAVLGEPIAFAAVLCLGIGLLAITVLIVAPRFGPLALAAASAPDRPTARSRRASRFDTASPARALRRKEWVLLLRDPWLLSQTLMQLLYLLPAAVILWRDFHSGGVTFLLVPILIVTAGQLGGGLAWLAVSGEDAPDLIATAPVPAAQVLRAKAEAVMVGIAMIFGPFVAMLAFSAPFAAGMTAGFVLLAACSATAIQYWFRTQARRSLFRRRQTSSRVATFAEALSSTGWAGTGALAATGTWLALVPGVLVLAVVGGAWLISPARSPAIA